MKTIQRGKITFYLHPDGHCTAADGAGWVSALFASLEAAESWADDFNAAEVAFGELNPPTGKGPNMLQIRKHLKAAE
jgi:hypothetical protein